MNQGITPGAVRCLLLGSVATGLLAAGTASAADPALATPDSYRSALNTMLGDLGDPESSFEFAKSAVDSGDLRGAVAAFERILRLNPTLANIELELGVLYLRLGNADLGRYHIRKALQAPNVPAVVRRRAESYLSTAPVQASRNSLRFDASVNARYDSNANAGPASDVVLFAGTPVFIGEGRQTEDRSIEGLLAATHDFAFTAEGNSALESRLVLFGNKYDELSNLDLTLAQLETGPLFRLGASTAPVFLRPFINGGHFTLDGNSYFSSYGGGLEVRKFTEASTAISLRVEYAEQDFKDRPDRFVSDRSGGYVQAAFSVSRQVGSHLQLSAELLAETSDTDASYQSYDRYGGGLGLRWFSTPGPKGPWSIGVSGRVREANYDSGDPQIDQTRPRSDTRVDARLFLSIPLSRTVALSLEGLYADNNSNLPNYDYDNTGASVGLNVQF